MDRDLFNRIVDFLVPYMGDPDSRKALIESALRNCAVLNAIEWRDDALTFTRRLVDQLDRYGTCQGDADPSLVVLLRAVGDGHGVDVQARASALIAELVGATGQDVVAGRYRLLERIGDKSGQGSVWQAIDTSDPQGLPVAVKLFKKHESRDYLGRFREEVRSVRNLESHPHIINIYDYGVDGEMPYIVMPVMSGSLTGRLNGSLSADEALHYLDQIAGALDFAHQHGIVHRDLKPANFLFTPETDLLCLSDFGISYRAERGQGVTGSGEIVGTEEYAAPEQLRGEDADWRADIYALATIAYELLAGRRPFTGSKVEISAAQLEKELPENPHLAPFVLEVLRTGAAKDKEKRPATASEFVQMLRDALAGRAPAAIEHYLSAVLEAHLKEVMPDAVFAGLRRAFVNPAGEIREQQVIEPEIELDLELFDTEFLRDDDDPTGPLDIELSGELHPPREARYSDDVEYTADVRQRIRSLRRVVLLGEPGAGKTFMLARLALDGADSYHSDPDQPLPVFVPLSRYNTGDDFATFVAGRLGVLGERLAELNVIWLLDALNEMPRDKGQWPHLKTFIDGLARDDVPFVLTCRVKNYDEELRDVRDLHRVDLQDLNPQQIYDILTHFLSPKAAAHIWRTVMHGGDDLLPAWAAWDGSVRAFWERPQDTWDRDDTKRRHLRARAQVHRDPRKLMLLCRNPFTLVRLLVPRMFKAVLGCRGSLDALELQLEQQLPNNRAQLFGQVIDDMLQAESRRQGWAENTVDAIKATLQHTAAALQGTQQRTEMALSDLLASAGAPADLAERLRMGRDAGLVTVDDTRVRFNHQLFQEYFATSRLRELLADYSQRHLDWEDGPPLPPRDERLAELFPDWWNAGGWQVTVTLLGELEGSTGISRVARWLASYTPSIALEALVEDNNDGLKVTDLSDVARQALTESARPLISEAHPVGRAAAYRVLGHPDINADDRPNTGVMVREDGLKLPDIDWVEIPDDGAWTYQEEKHPGLPAFQMARYPVTYAQFQCFVDAPDYHDDRWWAGMPEEEEAWGRTYRTRDLSEQRFRYANHPREMVAWYQAVAFCRWLSDKLGYEVTLPTEQQWEKAARGTDGRKYPYEGKFDAAKGNTEKTGISQTSAVGIFPLGASPYGVLDMSGNVFEWCLNKFETPDDMAVDASGARRVLRGGSWFNLDYVYFARAVYRSLNTPADRNLIGGFRVCVPPSLSEH